MKLTISQETLLEQLNNVIGAVEKKHTSKVLENILINATDGTLQFVGTDLEIEMSSEVPLQADVTGQITAPARKLFDICKALPSGCLILLEATDKQRLNIQGLRSKFELSTLPAEDFPILDDIPITQEIELLESDLKLLFDSVSFSMANQDVRYYLNGMLLEFNSSNIHAVTTDGHRLAISKYTSRNLKGVTEQKIIVPRKGILELSRLLDSTSKLPLKLQISENHIRINKDNIRFTSKLIDGKYPDYQAAIPTNCIHSIELDKVQFKDTLARVAILSNEKFRGIKINLNEGVMSLHSNNPDNEFAQEELDISFSGEPIEIGFNVTYLLEAVNHLEGERIILEISSPETSSLLYSNDNPNTRYIVMPIRL